MSNGIILFGLNGSGKSTLGKALADELHYKHMDIEDYCFIDSDIPYTLERTRDEYQNLMLKDIKEHKNFVLSAVQGNFLEEITSKYKLAVFIEVAYDIRMDRVEQRATDKFGDRVKKGGDMYESEKKFLDFVKKRTPTTVKKWSETLKCKTIYIDGTRHVKDNVDLIKAVYFKVLQIGTCLNEESI